MPRTGATPNCSHRKGLFFPKNTAEPPTIRYWCKICDESVGRMSDIRRHMSLHSNTFKFWCDLSGCRQVGGGVGFHQESNLKMHWKNAHAVGNRFACPHHWENRDGSIETCPARFVSTYSLEFHRIQAHGFKSGDDISKVEIPTLEGTVFMSNEEASQLRRRGRRGTPPGAAIFFEADYDDSDEAEVEFVQYIFSDPERLRRSLDASGIPYPTMDFKWPPGSSGGRQRMSKSSPESTPMPEQQHHYPAIPWTSAAPAQPLPYPLIANTHAGPSTVNQVNHWEQNTTNNSNDPALYPFLIQPLATGSAIPPTHHVPTQEMAMVVNVPLEAANLGYSLRVPDGVLAPHSSAQLHSTPAGTNTDPTVLVAPVPATSPLLGEMDIVNAGSSSSPSFYDPDGTLTLPGGEGDVWSDEESELAASVPAVEPDYHIFLDMSMSFSGGDEALMNFVWGC